MSLEKPKHVKVSLSEVVLSEADLTCIQAIEHNAELQTTNDHLLEAAHAIIGDINISPMLVLGKDEFPKVFNKLDAQEMLAWLLHSNVKKSKDKGVSWFDVMDETELVYARDAIDGLLGCVLRVATNKHETDLLWLFVFKTLFNFFNASKQDHIKLYMLMRRKEIRSSESVRKLCENLRTWSRPPDRA
jgi:hypothetical protein